jgi:hypothetical protein
LATLSPDVSDPFVYVANGTAGLTTVRIDQAPGGTPGAGNAVVRDTLSLGGETATAVRLIGDIAYVGTAEGNVHVVDLSTPDSPTAITSVAAGGAVSSLDAGAFRLYAGTDAGLAVFSIANPSNPSGRIDVGGFAALGIFHSAGHVYVAAGTDGVRDVDVTVNPPVDRGDVAAALAPGETVDARDVIVSVVPVQTWLLVADGTGDLVGLKLDNTSSTRERCLPDNNCGLDMDWRDPTIMGRDPSFDPNTGTFDATDPSADPFFRQSGALLTSAVRLARPALWEQLGTQTGRRVRDSFMPGSGALSFPVLQRMYGVQVCEDTNTPDINGNGLGELGYATGGQCTALATTARAAARKDWKTRVLEAARVKQP